MTLQNITLHYITLHYTTLHYIAYIHYIHTIKSHYIITLHCITLHLHTYIIYIYKIYAELKSCKLSTQCTTLLLSPFVHLRQSARNSCTAASSTLAAQLRLADNKLSDRQANLLCSLVVGMLCSICSPVQESWVVKVRLLCHCALEIFEVYITLLPLLQLLRRLLRHFSSIACAPLGSGTGEAVPLGRGV